MWNSYARLQLPTFEYVYMFYCALQQLVSHTAGEQSPNNWASSGAARRGAARPSRPQDAPHSTTDRRHLVADGPRPAALKPSHASRTPQPRRTTIGHFGFYAAFLLAGRYVSQKEGVAPNSACRAARPTEWRFSPPALRLRKALVLGKPRRGPQLRLRTAVSPPLPPPPSERKWWGRGSSVSALFALDKMAKIAKTHEGKRLKSARGGAL